MSENGNDNGTGVAVALGRKDWESDQEVRWCPGCGDYGILAAIQFLMPEIGIKPEEAASEAVTILKRSFERGVGGVALGLGWGRQ